MNSYDYPANVRELDYSSTPENAKVYFNNNVLPSYNKALQ